MVEARPAEINDPWIATSNPMVEELPNPNQWKSAGKPARGEQTEAEIMNNVAVTLKSLKFSQQKNFLKYIEKNCVMNNRRGFPHSP